MMQVSNKTSFLDLVLTTFEGRYSSHQDQALTLKALESKLDDYFQTFIQNFQNINSKFEAQEKNIKALIEKADNHQAQLFFHQSLIEEQGKDMRKGLEDLERRVIKEFDTSIIAKIGAMIRGAK